MRPHEIPGFAALVGCLLLASPGVRVVRADDARPAPASLAEEGGICRAEGPSQQVQLLESQLKRLAAERPAADDGTVVLNNRGYNYGAAPRVDPAKVLEEARRSQE